jgi:hypothetical protein
MIPEDRAGGAAMLPGTGVDHSSAKSLFLESWLIGAALARHLAFAEDLCRDGSGEETA